LANSRQISAATHAGHVRPTNEDRCCVGTWVSDGRNASWEGLVDCTTGWAVIADGMGGHDAGELASESAVRTIMGLIQDAQSEGDIVRMLEVANDRIYEEMHGGRGRPGMGSTVVGVALRGQRALMFNVGDSRLYLTRGAQLSQESVDDTIDRVLPSRAVRSHALTQSLGGGFSRLPFSPHVRWSILSEPEGVLLCSDGLTDMLSDKEIGVILSRQASHSARALVSAALDAGGLDNVSVVVIGTAA
jgi:serine/threonine protein phosphatase PrpC